ncbi:MAG: nucleoside hydrolase, partial [Woeseiaceae bacterium]
MLSRQILIDTDFHRYADDYEAVAMVAALVKRHEAKIAGITTVTGNAWASNCAKHARDALVDLGLDQVPVHQGAEQPLIHRQSDFAHRSRLYGAAFGGAWGNAALLESSPLIQPKPTNGAEAHAVEFLVTQLRNASEPMTILSIGPFTNIALAVRIAPDIVPKIGALFVMGGAFYVQGNVTPSAEFNWWFDAESAAIVLEQNIDITVVPLDATDSIVI